MLAKRSCFFVSVALLAAAPVASHAADARQAVNRPNIILIISEDNGPQLGCYGNPYVQTPNLDKLASQGVRFERAYITQAGCSQSRSSILTGLYPHQNGQLGLATWGYRLYRADTPNIPRSLQAAGYRTGKIGKLHINPESSFPYDMEEIPGGNFARKNLADYAQSGVALGDEVEILGEEFEVVGLSEETSSLVNSIAVISMDDFAALRGGYDTLSFLLVKVRDGESPAIVASRIQSRVRAVTVQTAPAFAAQERRVVKDMSTDVNTIMNLIGFLIGLAVMALTVYTATLSRRKEYGVQGFGSEQCASLPGRPGPGADQCRFRLCDR